MSFFSKPGKFLREALVARRERNREDHIRRHEEQRQHHVVYGTRRNLHQHVELDPHGSFIMPEWRSISEFRPASFAISSSPGMFEDHSHQHLPPLAEKSEGAMNEVKEDLNKKSSVDFDNPSTPVVPKRVMPPEEISLPDASGRNKQLREIPAQVDIPFGLPEDIPSDPIIFPGHSSYCWGLCHYTKYAVSKKLTYNYTHQSRFLKRIMTLLALKLAAIIIWIGIVIAVPELEEPIVKHFNYSYIPLGIFLGTKAFLRSMVRIRKMHRIGLLIVMVIRTICICYYCAAVTASSKTDIIIVAALILLLSCLFFALTPMVVDYNVSNTEIVGMACIVNLMFSALLLMPFVIVKYTKHFEHPVFNILIVNYLPGFIISQFIFMVVMFDLKQIMDGWRFPLGESDWVFTVLYL